MSRAKAPEISVLLPAFAAERTLLAALRSMQRQTEASSECIVVDDGSVDETRAIAERVAASDARVRVLGREHGGIVAALQAGLVECRAPLIARMDADDLMSRRRLELQRLALERAPELSAVGCHARLFPRQHLRDGRLKYEHWLGSVVTAEDVQREAFVECPVAHPTLMIRRNVLVELGYRDVPWPEDYDLLLRLLEAERAIGMVPQKLLHWRDGASRLSRCSERYSIAAFTECKAEFLARGFLARGERYLLWGFGDTGKQLAQALGTRGKLPAAIIELHPGRLGQLIRGVPVVAPAALPSLPPLPLVVSVAGLTARTEIRAALSGMGFREREQYVCAA
ncbi:MAG TPA: glycosyltransferase family A protein [Polyangiaceae bacterium]|nr:glycosyltransferase family A protein [Polyangiaceae bacterium]